MINIKTGNEIRIVGRTCFADYVVEDVHHSDHAEYVLSRADILCEDEIDWHEIGKKFLPLFPDHYEVDCNDPKN